MPCPQKICDTDRIKLTCDVGVPKGATLWSLEEGICDLKNDEIVLLQSGLTRCEVGEFSCGGFTAHNLDPGEDDQCTVSELYFNANAKGVNNGSIIECANIGLRSEEITSFTLNRWNSQELTPVIINTDSTFSGHHFTLFWQKGAQENLSDQYQLNISPPTDDCDPDCIVGANEGSQTYNFTFTHLDQESYHLTVTVNDACYGQPLSNSLVISRNTSSTSGGGPLMPEPAATVFLTTTTATPLDGSGAEGENGSVSDTLIPAPATTTLFKVTPVTTSLESIGSEGESNSVSGTFTLAYTASVLVNTTPVIAPLESPGFEGGSPRTWIVATATAVVGGAVLIAITGSVMAICILMLRTQQNLPCFRA